MTRSERTMSSTAAAILTRCIAFPTTGVAAAATDGLFSLGEWGVPETLALDQMRGRHPTESEFAPPLKCAEMPAAIGVSFATMRKDGYLDVAVEVPALCQNGSENASWNDMVLQVRTTKRMANASLRPGGLLLGSHVLSDDAARGLPADSPHADRSVFIDANASSYNGVIVAEFRLPADATAINIGVREREYVLWASDPLDSQGWHASSDVDEQDAASKLATPALGLGSVTVLVALAALTWRRSDKRAGRR